MYQCVMPTSNHKLQIKQEQRDAMAVCVALRQLLEEKNVSSLELSPLTGISSSAIRRMTDNQEPKASVLARIERALGVELGTVVRAAGLVSVGDIEQLLASDPALHVMLRKTAVESYRGWVKVSLAERR